RTVAPERRRSRRDPLEGRVCRQTFELPAEDGMVLGRPLVAGPALDQRELAWVLERDVEGAVAAFRQARDAAPLPRGHPAVAVDGLAAAPERCARDLDLLDASLLRDIGGVARRRKPTVEPVVLGIPVHTDEANGNEGTQGGDQHWREPASRHGLVLQSVRLSSG